MKIIDYRIATHCIYCEREFILGDTRLQKSKDHIIPRSRGGINHLDNYVAACRYCNELKSGCTLLEFARLLQRQLRRYSDIPLHKKIRINALKLYNKTSWLHKSTVIVGARDIFFR